MLEEEDRVVVADRGRHHPLHVGRERRRHDLEPRDRHRPILDALGVLRAEARAAAVARLDHERQLHLAVRHVARLRDLVHDDVPADREEVRKHDLGDRPQARHRGAHRGAQDRLLGDRRVAHARRAELVEQADGRLEHAARARDVLAEEHDVFVAAHLLRHAGGDRVAIG